MTSSTKLQLGRDLQALAAAFAISGTLHMVRPQVFQTIVPRRLPTARGLVYASGVAEIACAAGLVHPATRKAAGWASALLLVAVFPANLQMAVTEGKRANVGPAAEPVARWQSPRSSGFRCRFR